MEYFYSVFLGTLILNIILFYFKNEKSFYQCLKDTIFTQIFSFTSAVLIIRLIFNESIFVVQTKLEMTVYNMILFLFTLVISLIFLYIKKYKIVNNKTNRSMRKKTVIYTLKFVSFIFFTLGLIMLIVIGWSIDFYGEIRPEQFIYNITSNSQGTNYNVMKNILHTPLLIVSCLSLLFFLFLFMKIPAIKMKNKQKKIHWNYLRTISLSLISLSVLFLGVNYAVKTEYLDATYNAFLKDSDYIERNYVNPSKIELKFPEKKRNLIHIYAESFENSYTSKELGGNMDENLIPNLTELAETSGFNFSHNDVIGGWNQTYGSSWSIAGIINMETGLPLKLAIDGNSYGKEGNFLPGITNLGDILNNASYNQTVLMGSDAKFAGRDVYFKEHGNYSIFDVNEAKRQNLIPEDYNEWWGFEDDKLFEFAKGELTRLNNLDQPFHLNMITADTHFPDGYASKNMTRTRTSQYADVIAYSDEQMGQFIRWIKEQPFYENTTIVITGDHLSMDKTFFQDFPSEYKRAPFNIFINAPFKKEEIQTKNREFAAFDMFPTIIASLGIEIPHNKMGLGTNLFSREKTEIELNTINVVNEELEKYSKYYDTAFLNK